MLTTSKLKWLFKENGKNIIFSFFGFDMPVLDQSIYVFDTTLFLAAEWHTKNYFFY